MLLCACHSTVGLYKIFVCIFRDCALVTSSIATKHLLYFTPLYLAHKQYRAMYGSPSTPLLYVRHHTTLVMAILCKGQLDRTATACDDRGSHLNEKALKALNPHQAVYTYKYTRTPLILTHGVSVFLLLTPFVSHIQGLPPQRDSAQVNPKLYTFLSILIFSLGYFSKLV